MLNITILSGRITHDLELKQTPSGGTVLSFSLAVERAFARQGEERKADFISCVAWGKTAEFIYNYFSKGSPIAVRGNLRTRTYDDKNGSRHYVTELYIDEAQFTFAPKEQAQQASYTPAPPAAPTETRGAAEWAHVPQNNKSADVSEFEGMDIFNDDGVPF